MNSKTGWSHKDHPVFTFLINNRGNGTPQVVIIYAQ